MSKKIAPTLSRFVEERSCGQDVCRGKSSCHVAAEELRALLAVVSAADRALSPGGQWIQAAGGSAIALHAYIRARARLDALSRPPRSSGTGKRKEGTR